MKTPLSIFVHQEQMRLREFGKTGDKQQLTPEQWQKEYEKWKQNQL